jgi:hypothetical protein
MRTSTVILLAVFM